MKKDSDLFLSTLHSLCAENVANL